MNKTATVYRMVTDAHICPYGLKAKDLLERNGYQVEDHQLKNDRETNAIKKKYKVDTTPQIFIGDKRVGGYDSLRERLGLKAKGKNKVSYGPVVAIFSATFLMALALNWNLRHELLSMQLVVWFIAISMCVLAIFKLRDLEAFSLQFLGYDLLAQKVVRYAYFYPFAEAFAGIGMLAGILQPLVGTVALFIGSVGAVSVFKAVYIDKRELKCACVGGDSQVPLGFVSLTENLMMVFMGTWVLGQYLLRSPV